MASWGTSGVFARTYADLDRSIEVGLAGGRVIAVSFPDAVPEDAAGRHSLLDRFETYLAGEPTTFADVAVGLTVPTDRRDVLSALRDIRHGEEVSVSRLTRLAGLDPDDPDDLETVTRALRDNPIPILVPDHRVQGGPYATPADVRKRLRAIEGLP
ncbi:MGMT family protein [Halorubrum vacuolatum]|uniref:Methylated-DNA-[protein]-cysteine S-methyltransferase n=1 Tax=Halorubrum vacuolatum TaxID=63740 RepID=A0A238W2N1_HALVU|nr:MGMT family protein [Halorubrum vacuolatum]SNR40820.1 methylated-DNA-[protein]-cysteine S-methyltransferase [Halorubrum vacuolatum]